MDATDLSLFKKTKREKSETADACRVSSNTSNSLGSQIEGMIISKPTEEDTYNCNNPNAGIALVFNHKHISGQKARLGTEKDRDAVQQTLLDYGYDVRVFNDLPYDELRSVLLATAREDHSDNDCLIVTVMTHGLEGQLYAQDKSYPVEELWKPFLGENCKTLINKPKIFFIQACRGTKLEKPVAYLTVAQSMSAAPRAALRRAFHLAAEEKPPTIMYAIPSTADMIVMYSTFEKYYSFRNVKDGSWFIQSLCRVLNEAAAGPALSQPGAELLNLLTAVNRKVAYEYQANSSLEVLNQMKSMPNFLSSLTKTFYLRIKVNKN